MHTMIRFINIAFWRILWYLESCPCPGVASLVKGDNSAIAENVISFMRQNEVVDNSQKSNSLDHLSIVSFDKDDQMVKKIMHHFLAESKNTYIGSRNQFIDLSIYKSAQYLETNKRF